MKFLKSTYDKHGKPSNIPAGKEWARTRNVPQSKHTGENESSLCLFVHAMSIKTLPMVG